ncbi:MAG: S8 family serine peptidase, partial [Aquiluna sp.]
MRLVTALLLTAMTITPTAEDQWWLADYQQLELDGSGVRVAVIDTGIDDSHPDLDGVVIDGADFSGVGTPDGTSPVGPGGFHGTMVASLIAGQGGTTGGVIGIAPSVELLAISIGLGVPG